MNMYLRKLLRKMAYSGWLNALPDESYLKILFWARLNRRLDLKNPVTLNEKLQWIKLHDRKEIYTTQADKYAVKAYLKEKIDPKYIIPTLGVWDRAEDIDFSSLPRQFVLKTTHDSGNVVICWDKDKLDMQAARAQMAKGLQRNYFLASREWPYRDIKRRIIAEPLLGNGKTLPEDYKFYTFHGEIDSVMVCKGRDKGHPKFYFFDLNWKRLFYQKDEPEETAPIQKPANFDEMVDLVRTLCADFAHIRIDLYNVDGQISFGEYTFFNQSGFDTDFTYETDKMLGEKLHLFQSPHSEK